MWKIHIQQDISPDRRRVKVPASAQAVDEPATTPPPPGSRSSVAVPRYVLYGDTDPRPKWFVNLEPLDRRCRERGWVIKPHVHPRFTQLMIVNDGGGLLTLEGQDHAFRPGSVVVVPPHRIHGFRYDHDTTGWVLTIENHYLDDLLERAPALRALMLQPGVFDIAPALLPEIAAGAQRLDEELGGERSGSAIGAEIHLMSILLLLYRHWQQTADHAPPRAPGHGRTRLVERYKEVVEARFREQPTMEQIARELRVSVSQLRLACTGIAGLSPLAILHERILAEARRCLAYTGMSITEIADALGFAEASYFTRFFTRKTGLTPSDWRRSQSRRLGLDET